MSEVNSLNSISWRLPLSPLALIHLTDQIWYTLASIETRRHTHTHQICRCCFEVSRFRSMKSLEKSVKFFQLPQVHDCTMHDPRTSLGHQICHEIHGYPPRRLPVPLGMVGSDPTIATTYLESAWWKMPPPRPRRCRLGQWTEETIDHLGDKIPPMDGKIHGNHPGAIQWPLSWSSRLRRST